MAAMLKVLDPTAPLERSTLAAQPSLPRLRGAVVGFIDNSKPNFDHLADALTDLLSERCGVRSVIKRRKRAASVPAPDEVLDELAGQCDLVITGSGD